MAVRSSSAVWTGTLKKGLGSVSLGSGTFKGEYSFPSRFEEGKGTNPEELIGAAIAGCYSMALAGALEQAGFVADKVETRAQVHIDKVGDGFTITAIELIVAAVVPRISEKLFLDRVEETRKGCPVARALTGTTISTKASLG
jgi:osmotically inducible protein OsmC